MGEEWWAGLAPGAAGSLLGVGSCPPGLAVGVSAGGGAGAGCCRCSHRRRASPLTCLAVCFLVLTYNLLGGFLFLALEGGGARQAVAAASRPDVGSDVGTDVGPATSTPPAHPAPATGIELRSKTVERLWSITEDLNILYKENWTKLAAKELLDFQRVLVQTMSGADVLPPAPDEYRWTFSTSFLYALTLITTIGHGNVMPQSAAGKVVAVCYACVGIPLVMLYLSTVGEAMARRVRALYSRVRPAPLAPRRAAPLAPHRPAPSDPAAFKRTPFQAALNLDALGRGARVTCRAHARVPIALSLLPVASYVALGAAVFRATERWSLVDGCYFSFSSLATIGFGALRPGRHAGASSPRAEDAAVGVCCAYILVGIAVVAMCFNLVQEELGAALRGVASPCGAGGARGAGRGARADKVGGAAPS